MWICLNDGFLSIVRNNNDDETLLVRARSEEHLNSIFPNCKSWYDGKADYPFRAYIQRALVAEAIANRLKDIEYPNFKASVDDYTLMSAYAKVWEIMRNHFDVRYRYSRQTTLDEFGE